MWTVYYTHNGEWAREEFELARDAYEYAESLREYGCEGVNMEGD